MAQRPVSAQTAPVRDRRDVCRGPVTCSRPAQCSFTVQVDPAPLGSIQQVSGALGTQMKYAAARSEIVVLAHEDLDSLEATPFDSISAGVNYTIVTVEGLQYYSVSTVTEVTPVLYQIMVSLTSLQAGAPTYTTYSYTSDDW